MKKARYFFLIQLDFIAKDNDVSIERFKNQVDVRRCGCKIKKKRNMSGCMGH